MVYLMRLPRVREVFGGMSKPTVYEHVNAGLMPLPVKTGPRGSAWPSDEIELVVAARIAGKSNDDVRALVVQLHDRRKQAFTRLSSVTGGLSLPSPTRAIRAS
jgi:prophage regulatory protein